MDDGEVLGMVAESTEFRQLKVYALFNYLIFYLI